MEAALRHPGASLFAASTFALASAFRYARCSGAVTPNVRAEQSSSVTDGSDADAAVTDLLSRCPSLHNYTPSYLSAIDIHGVLSTAFPVIIRVFHRIFFSTLKYRREVITTEDGGTIALDYASTRECSEDSIAASAPMVVIHHGLCGDAQSEYLIRAAETLLGRGYRVLVLVARGCGGLALTSEKTFSASRIVDLELAVFTMRESHPLASACLGLSYSLGAGIMLNYLGKSSKVSLDGAICVSPAWDFFRSTHLSLLFDPLLALSIKTYALTHRTELRLSRLQALRVLFAMSSYELETFLVHMHGYRSVEEYYFDSSACYSSQNISCSTLAISSEDDPICCHTGCTVVKHGSGLVVVKTLTGGHLGFLENTLSPDSWVERVAVDWFGAVVATMSAG